MNMKKQYTKPEVDILEVTNDDFLTCSCGHPGNHYGHHKVQSFEEDDSSYENETKVNSIWDDEEDW